MTETPSDGIEIQNDDASVRSTRTVLDRGEIKDPEHPERNIAQRILTRRITSMGKESFYQQLSLSRQILANLEEKCHQESENANVVHAIHQYRVHMACRASTALEGFVPPFPLPEDTTPEELALLEQNDNLACMTFMFRLKDGVLLVHSEEDNESKDAYTNRLVKYSVGGKEFLCYLYPKLLPGIGAVVSSDVYHADDYLKPLTDAYHDPSEKRAGLVNMVGHMLLMNEFQPGETVSPEGDRLTIEHLVRALGGVYDATSFTRASRNREGVQIATHIVQDASPSPLPRHLESAPGSTMFCQGTYPLHDIPADIRRAAKHQNNQRERLYIRDTIVRMLTRFDLFRKGPELAQLANALMRHRDMAAPDLLNAFLKRIHAIDNKLKLNQTHNWLINDEIARRALFVMIMTDEGSWSAIIPQGQLPVHIDASQLELLTTLHGEDAATMDVHLVHLASPSIDANT